MTELPFSHLSKGSFLIASPEVLSSTFSRGVVLLCEHNEGGSFALLINKPLEMELPEEILDRGKSANKHIQIRSGGPKQPQQMILLHSSSNIEDKALKVCEDVYLGGDLHFLQEVIQQPNGPYVYLCFGYCGWGPGALEKEYLEGKWFLHPATSYHVFETPHEKLWQTLLREMGGKYATLSLIPEDLSLN